MERRRGKRHPSEAFEQKKLDDAQSSDAPSMAIFTNFDLTLASFLQITVASKWTIALASLPSRHRVNEFAEKNR
jgi:hypothetical protein